MNILNRASDVLHRLQVLYILIGYFAAVTLHETLISLHYSRPGHLSLNPEPIGEFGMAGALQCAIALSLQLVKIPPTPAWLIGEVLSDLLLAKLQS